MNWNEFLKNEAEKQYFIKIKEKLKEKHLNGIVIYPPQEQIFNAFNLTPFDKVKVIILGQDPYHGSGQAMGLSFSVPDDKPIPPSLKNVFKEIEDDLQIKCLKSGDLTRWAEQGVFLLNTSLTVEAGLANSHENIGWKNLTASALKELNNDNSPKVFILWGNNAKKLKFILTNPAHLILESAHPSPLSAYRGFFGNKHFSQANQFLIEHKLSPIDWR
jgi:uracil-DNA glycosylase